VSTISRSAADAGARQERHLPGEEGTWVFILGDMTVFAVFFATYLYYRGQQRELFEASQRELVQVYGVINTLLLLTSSLCVALGMRAVRRRLAGAATLAAPRLFGGALACGLGFSVMKFVEYGGKLAAGITPATNNFFMYYFILTGLHFFHLILGMAVLLYLIRSARRPTLDARQFAFVEGGACFWHMVDLVWIVLFPLLYLVK
jgi:nitric oxide reductase NorE protein